MNTSFFSTFLIVIICATLFVAVINRSSKTTASKGKAGEVTVASIISRFLNKGLYGHVLRNLYVPKPDGGTSEVDVLLVCTKGIFVFESKNYAGWVFGDDKSKFWTVTLYGGKDWLGSKQTQKHRFYNPIWQNSTHINCLKRLIGNRIPMNSIVVFSDRGELKKVDAGNSDVTILKTGGLRRFMSTVEKTYEDVLTNEQVDSIYNKLLPLIDVDGEKLEKHLSYINEQQHNPTKCPRCGGKLVIRTAKKGVNAGTQFYGCSNYPECKYTRNIE